MWRAFSCFLTGFVFLILPTTNPAAPKAQIGDGESRELLSLHETVAEFQGLDYRRCLGRTGLCPDRCGHSGEFATFRIVDYLAYEKPGEYGDPKQETYRIQVSDFDKKQLGDPAILKLVGALKAGDRVALSWQHDYVTKAGSRFPERVVTRLDPLEAVARPKTAPALKPLLARPADPYFQSDFAKPGPLDRKIWQPRQATRWEQIDGVLRGVESTAENQAAKKDHKGLGPRISVPGTPGDFIARFRVRFAEGRETAIVPFFEFGHHVARIRMHSKEGVSLLVDHETLKVAADPEFRWTPGEWYSVLAEKRGDELVVQFADGPTLYARHPALKEKTPKGANGLGFAGPRHGIVEIDDLTISGIAGEARDDWQETRAGFPKFDPMEVKERPPGK